jgi:excisionase family DNA binding protein
MQKGKESGIASVVTAEAGAPPSPVMTVKEVMAELRMSKNAIYGAVARHQIPAIRIGAKILIPRAAFQKMIGGEAV